MPASHWSQYHERWARLAPPLRPSASVAAAMAELAGERPGPALLLGVTPELADIAGDVTAVDRSQPMIDGIWPGDTARRRAVCADWLALPFEARCFATILGDGSLNALTYPDGHAQLYRELARVLTSDGRAVIRVFRRPAPREPRAAVMGDALGGRIASFHGFKWRLAMALVAEGTSPNIGVQHIHDAFTSAVPDRAVLAGASGWSRDAIDTIDVYRGSSEVYSFPSGVELLEMARSAFQIAELREVGGYELAERCPLLVLERPR